MLPVSGADGHRHAIRDAEVYRPWHGKGGQGHSLPARALRPSTRPCHAALQTSQGLAGIRSLLKDPEPLGDALSACPCKGAGNAVAGDSHLALASRSDETERGVAGDRKTRAGKNPRVAACRERGRGGVTCTLKTRTGAARRQVGGCPHGGVTCTLKTRTGAARRQVGGCPHGGVTCTLKTRTGAARRQVGGCPHGGVTCTLKTRTGAARRQVGGCPHGGVTCTLKTRTGAARRQVGGCPHGGVSCTLKAGTGAARRQVCRSPQGGVTCTLKTDTGARRQVGRSPHGGNTGSWVAGAERRRRAGDIRAWRPRERAPGADRG